MLIAFCATSLITLIAIASAYLLDILPERNHANPAVQGDDLNGLLNDLDKSVIRHCSPFRRLIGNASQETKNKQYKALQRFVLTLSDQQIVTGLAIFIIGYSKHCTMFTYHFFIIVALGWFSSTTHLSTLTVLQDYFKESPGLKYTRLLRMLATFILLFIRLLVLYTNYAFRVPVQCRFNRMSISMKALNYVCMVVVLCYLIIIFLSRSLGFCFNRQRPFSSIQGILSYSVHRDNSRLTSRK